MNEDSSQDVLREETVPFGTDSLSSADYEDPVVEAFKKDVDRTLLRENLKLTPNERSLKFEQFMQLAYELRRAGQRNHQPKSDTPHG